MYENIKIFEMKIRSAYNLYPNRKTKFPIIL